MKLIQTRANVWKPSAMKGSNVQLFIKSIGFSINLSQMKMAVECRSTENFNVKETKEFLTPP